LNSLASTDRQQPAAGIVATVESAKRRGPSGEGAVGTSLELLATIRVASVLPSNAQDIVMAKQPKQPKQLEDLFEEVLKDIYYAEKKILTALPKMAKAAQSPDLKAAFQKHEDETEGQIDRLEKVFALLDTPPKGKKCPAIEGPVKEGQEGIKEFKGSPALDAALLATAQAVEHYEISRYGTLKAWAEKLDMPQAVKLLDQTLTEEKNTDEALTELAEAAINDEAQEAAE
jgi:ferritin-like metal-binding protein YciE